MTSPPHNKVLFKYKAIPIVLALVIGVVLVYCLMWRFQEVGTSPKQQFFDHIADGNVAAVKSMLTETPALLNETNELGFPPLMCAVSSMNRSVECVEILLAAGANVKVKTNEGYTALHMAVDAIGPNYRSEMPAQIISLLVDAGADLEAKQHWGWTPLMRAVVEGTTDEVRALIDHGANPNHVFPRDTLPACHAGVSMLMAAVGEPEKVSLLIEAGADVSAVDMNGETVLEYARELLKDIPSLHGDFPDNIVDEVRTKTRASIEILEKAGG